MMSEKDRRIKLIADVLSLIGMILAIIALVINAY